MPPKLSVVGAAPFFETIEISVFRRIVFTTLHVLYVTGLATKFILEVVGMIRNTIYCSEILNVEDFKATRFCSVYDVNVTIFRTLQETMCAQFDRRHIDPQEKEPKIMALPRFSQRAFCQIR